GVAASLFHSPLAAIASTICLQFIGSLLSPRICAAASIRLSFFGVLGLPSFVVPPAFCHLVRLMPMADGVLPVTVLIAWRTASLPVCSIVAPLLRKSRSSSGVDAFTFHIAGEPLCSRKYSSY